MPLYKLLSRHSAAHVAKSAKRLLFGFTAGDYLKAHTITYVSLSVILTGMKSKAPKMHLLSLMWWWHGVQVCCTERSV